MSKNVKFLLLLGILFYGFPAMYGEDLYVWKMDGSKQTFGLENVQKLTFTEDALVVTTTTSESVSYEELRLFTLKDLNLGSVGTGLAEITATAKLLFNPATGEVTITDTQEISSVGLFNLQGQQLQRYAPASHEATLSVAAYPAGVYLLQIADANGMVTKKIIKKQ
jgi:hypothetical protein